MLSPHKLLVAIATVSGVLASANVYATPWTLTATGSISPNYAGYSNAAGLFGAPNELLFGLNYEITITTDPALNTFGSSATPVYNERYGGPGFGGAPNDSGAPFSIAMTVNGSTYTQSGVNPLVNRSYLLNPLSANDSTTTLQDQVQQAIQSAGCSNVYLQCVSAYILAFSETTPFVPNLNFGQSISIFGGMAAGSNSYFRYRASSGLETTFYGSVDSLQVNSVSTVPEPGTLALLGLGLAGIGFARPRYAKRALRS